MSPWGEPHVPASLYTLQSSMEQRLDGFISSYVFTCETTGSAMDGAEGGRCCGCGRCGRRCCCCCGPDDDDGGSGTAGEEVVDAVDAVVWFALGGEVDLAKTGESEVVDASAT
jgi:hypothetical protein